MNASERRIESKRRVNYLIEEFDSRNDFSLAGRSVLIAATGSHAYNTFTESSDYDYTGIVVPTARHLIGLGKTTVDPNGKVTFNRFESWEPKAGSLDDGLDLKVYGIEKAIRLLLKGNPNMTELLWMEDHLYAVKGRYFDHLIANREIFMSKRGLSSLGGYASGQFKKMTAGATKGYMGHKRKELVNEIGYDPKDASHLIRLLYAGIHMAREHELRPWLDGEQRAVVMEIKSGKVLLGWVKHLAAELEAEYNDARSRTTLPDEPDVKAAEKLLMDIIREHI